MVKRCKFNPHIRCSEISCGIFDYVSGNIHICSLFQGGKLFTPRVVKPDLVRRGRDGSSWKGVF